MVSKTLYFRMQTLIHNYWYNSSTVNVGIEWYHVNLSSNYDEDDWDSDHNFDPYRKQRTRETKRNREEKQPTPIDPIWNTTPPTAIPWLNCNCVASGSTVYAITEGSRICSVNAADLSGRWSAIQPSASRILYAQAAALDGKIYLFGAPLECCSGENPYNFDFTVAEVFDTNTNMFEIISPPPFQFPPSTQEGCFAVADASHERIILGSFRRGVLLAYYARNRSWETLDLQFHNRACDSMSHAVLFDNTLYWVWVAGGEGGIFAYNLDRKMAIFGGPIIHLPPVFYRNSDLRPLFFHICGDQFYLLWIDGGDTDTQTLVHFVRVRVCWKTPEKLRAYTLSQQTYQVDGTLSLTDGVML